MVFSNCISKRHFKLNTFKNHTSNLSLINLPVNPHHPPVDFLILIDGNSILLVTPAKNISHATPFSFSPSSIFLSSSLPLILQLYCQQIPLALCLNHIQNRPFFTLTPAPSFWIFR